MCINQPRRCKGPFDSPTAASLKILTKPKHSLATPIDTLSAGEQNSPETQHSFSTSTQFEVPSQRLSTCQVSATHENNLSAETNSNETKHIIKFIGLTKKNHRKHLIQHNYQDHSHDTPNSFRAKPKRKGGVPVQFPLRLHQLLDDIEGDSLSTIVSWQSHGRSFIVHDQKEFVRKILPTYFRQSKIGSFQRQLNLYGFARFSGGKDRGSYYHELFLRGKPFLAEQIKRTKVKGTVVRGTSNPDSEPDFYVMESIAPLRRKFTRSESITSILSTPSENCFHNDGDRMTEMSECDPTLSTTTSCYGVETTHISMAAPSYPDESLPDRRRPEFLDDEMLDILSSFV